MIFHVLETQLDRCNSVIPESFQDFLIYVVGSGFHAEENNLAGRHLVHEHFPDETFLGSEVGVIAVYGIGAIGSVVANDLKHLGFKVEGWSRTQKNICGVNCYSGENKFEVLLKNCDIHICLLPLTPETTNIFNNSSFKMMKYGSCFINGGRGEQVVEGDLIENCKSGQISSAILDVYCKEPLPKNSKLWEQENIRIWPHVAAETNPETAAKQIANAIKCIENGKSPPNIVKRKLGY